MSSVNWSTANFKPRIWWLSGSTHAVWPVSSQTQHYCIHIASLSPAPILNSLPRSTTDLHEICRDTLWDRYRFVKCSRNWPRVSEDNTEIQGGPNWMIPDALFLKKMIHESYAQLVFPVMFLYKTYYFFPLIFPLFSFFKGTFTTFSTKIPWNSSSILLNKGTWRSSRK